MDHGGGSRQSPFAALQRWHSKFTVVYVMAAAGIIGVVLQHTVV